MPDLSLVHLVWAPLGLTPVHEFVRAYQEHPAGCDHHLVVTLNGFASAAEREPVLRTFAALKHDVIVMPRAVQDIPAYFETARQLDSEFVGFLNSHSRPLVDGWLVPLASHARRREVGIVGATGSWESHASNHIRPLESWPRSIHPRRWAGWLRRTSTPAMRALEEARQYALFPNAHLRTNAFVLRRSLLLDLHHGPLTTKSDAHAFESGRRGLTAQVRRRGLGVLVAGRDGVGYPPDTWPTSHTYRSGDQQNLLVADNRTRVYADSDPPTRRALRAAAWGSE